MKNFYFVILMLVFLAATAWLIWSYTKYAKVNTGQTETIVNLEVTGGNLQQEIIDDLDGETEVVLDEVLMSNNDVATGGILKTQVKDHRGTAAGWTQTMTCSHFYSEENKIDVSNLVVKPSIIIPQGESDLSGVYLGEAHQMLDENDQVVIMYALEGAGEGRFEAESALELFIDRSTPAGSYTAQMTVTVV